MTPLGLFPVAASRGDVDAFRAATGLPPGDGVPLTFPMRWLAEGDVRAAVLALVGDDEIVPFHESQVFEYARPLLPEQRYAMRVEARRAADPDRLIVGATVDDAAGHPAVALETILRLFSSKSVPA